MRASTPLFLASLLVSLIGGCIPSLYPIYTSDTLADCSGLIGKWTSEDGNQSWVFSGDSDRQCQLLYTDDRRQQGRFTARLTRIGEDLFMDLQPQPEFAQDTASFYKLHWQQMHTFYRIQLDDNSLRLSFLNPKWLKKYLPANPGTLDWQHADGDSAFLTSRTSQLREFVRAHRSTPDAFSNPVPLKRVTGD